MNQLKLDTFIKEEFLLNIYEYSKQFKISVAGFPGEGNVNWNSIVLYYQSFKEAYSISPDVDLLIEKLNLNIRLARIMILGINGEILKHKDNFLSQNVARLHIPIITNSDFDFYIEDEKCEWLPGELWYGDFSKEHYGKNRGKTERVHLVLDILVDELFSQKLPFQYQYLAKKNDINTFKINLKKFSCSFKMPKEISTLYINNQKIEIDEDIIFRIVNYNDSLFFESNYSPFLNVLPLDEDTLALEGIENTPILLKYIYQKEEIASINLSIQQYDFPLILIN